jgi:pimeloyl-ACP methyl ester carboxylesterase
VEIDWADATSVVDYLVDYWRVLCGQERAFDEAHIRELALRDVARARDIAAAQNHAIAPKEDGPRDPLSSIAAPTLVIHGTDDPLFPVEHGAALANEIPRARLLPLEGAGHGVDPADWETVTRAILEHTRARRSRRAGKSTTGDR